MDCRRNILFCIVFWSALTIAAWPVAIFGQEGAGVNSDSEIADDFEEDMTGFDEDSDSGDGFSEEAELSADELQDLDLESVENQVVQLGGFFKEDLGYSFEHESDQPEFSRIRSTLNLSAQVRISENWRATMVWNGFYDYAYNYFGRNEFSDETLDTYETESEIRDFFIDGAIFSWMRLKIGRQIIAWGESETNQITDLANPRENRELGMVDIEDARIPVAATKLSIVFNPWEINLVAIHENRPNKTPSEGSEFDTLAALRDSIRINDEEVPENSIENTEYLARIFRSFNGGDLALVWADVYDDGYYLDFESFNALAPVKKLTVTPKYKRFQSIGISGNLVRGSWIFKTELARKTGVAVVRNQVDLVAQMAAAGILAGSTGITYYNKDTGIIETWSEKDLTQGLLAFEFSGFDDLTISLEGSLEKIEDYDENLSSDEISGSVTAHIGYTTLNDRFDADFYWFHLTDDNGEVYRFNVDYDLRDALNLSGGMIFYEAEKSDARVYPFRKNDRVFAALKYSF